MGVSYDIIFLKGTEGYINEVERIILGGGKKKNYT